MYSKEVKKKKVKNKMKDKLVDKKNEQGTDIKGYSNPLSAACNTVSTANLNHIVENFYKRLIYYLYVKLKVIYEDLPKGIIYKLAENYCFKYFLKNTNDVAQPKSFALTPSPGLSPMALDMFYFCYKHDFNFHQECVTSEMNGVVCEMKKNQEYFYTCMECKTKLKGFELLKRHYNINHTFSTLSNSKRNFEEFTFEEGCERQHLEGKKRKSVHLLKELGMVPSVISMHNEEENNTYHLYNAVKEEKIETIRNLQLLQKNLTCQLNIYSNNNNNVESINNTDVVPAPKMLSFHDFPAFGDKMGDYIEINEEIESKLNKKKQDFHSLLNLFAGGLIRVKNITIMILAVEVYVRDVLVDCHAESSYNSFPQSIDKNDRYYKSIKTVLNTQSEGGQPINKLVIGTTSLNILITSTFILSPRCDETATVGPTAPLVLNGCNLNNAIILLRRANAAEYVNEDAKKYKFDVAHCRQLTSGVGSESTYLPYRHLLFDSMTLRPVTIFTLHLLPLVGFSLSKTNPARKTSMFFSMIAKCIMKRNGVLEMKKLNKIQKLNIENQSLDPILVSLEEKIANSKDKNVNIVDFLSQQNGLSKLAQSLSGSISSANKKIQGNITTFLSGYLGEN